MMLASIREAKIATRGPHSPIELVPQICQDLPEIVRNYMRAYNTPHTNHRPLKARPARFSGPAVTAARHLQLNPPAPCGPQRARYFFRFLFFRSKLCQIRRGLDLSLPLRWHRAFRRADPKIPGLCILAPKYRIFPDFWPTFCRSKKHQKSSTSKNLPKS